MACDAFRTAHNVQNSSHADRERRRGCVSCVDLVLRPCVAADPIGVDSKDCCARVWSRTVILRLRIVHVRHLATSLPCICSLTITATRTTRPCTFVHRRGAPLRADLAVRRRNQRL